MDTKNLVVAVAEESMVVAEESMVVAEEAHAAAADVAPKRDYLKADPSVPGQDFCVMAFISPEDRVLERTLYETDLFLNEMMNEYITASAVHMARDINARLVKQFEAQIVKLKKSKVENHRIIAEEMQDIRRRMHVDEEEFAAKASHNHGMEFDDLMAKFEDFKTRRNAQLEKGFNEKFGEATSVRGVKFCGAFPYQEAAVERAEFLAKEVEPGVHHYVASSFQWLPFDPNADAVKDNRYQNPDLDELMRRRKENEEQRDRFFQDRKREEVEKAKQKNKNLKKELKKKLKAKQNKL